MWFTQWKEGVYLCNSGNFFEMMKVIEFSTYIIKFSGLYGRLVPSYNAMILPLQWLFSLHLLITGPCPLQLIASPPAMIARREISLSLSLPLSLYTANHMDIDIHKCKPNYIYRTSQPTLLSLLITHSPSDQQHI